MISLLALDFTIAVSVIAFILVVGIAVLLLVPRLSVSGIELEIAVAAGIVVCTLLGLGLALQPLQKTPVAAVLLALSIAGSTIVLIRRGADVRLLWPAARLSVASWFALSALAIIVANYPARTPADLPDGLYVQKQTLLSVQIQYMLGLPMDNAIPAVAGEYLFQKISFRRERPLMPGQEVTNRPILVSLAALPFRAIYGPAARSSSPLPRFSYVGTS